MKTRTACPTSWPIHPGLTCAAATLALLAATPAASGVRYQIHTAPEILATRVQTTSGLSGQGTTLRFTDLSGRRWDLITDINDPSISNRGSGSFHPADAIEVERALEAVEDDAMTDLVVDVFLLPYPRRGLLASSADRGAIYLSPGVHPYPAAQLHMLVTHELGHVFQYRFLPDSDGAGWAAYRQLRGLTDTSIYHASASHRNRPHEIFAEDFRVLFGGELANYSTSIENPALTYPTQVPGLESFLLGLGSSTASAGDGFGLVSSPNPFHPLTTIRFRLDAGSHIVNLEIVDVRGRLIRQLAAEELTEGTYEYRWDGRTTNGDRVASGVYFARLTADQKRTHHKLILAR